MVSPLHPGHPIVGIPPVYSPRNVAAPMATSMMASIDQHLFTADRTAIEVFLRRWPEGVVRGFWRDRLVALATHTFLSLTRPAHHGSHHRSGARYATPPCRGGSADSARGPDPCSAGSAGGTSSGQ